MNLKEIREMLNLMNEHNLVELEIEREGLRIRLKKKGAIIQEEIAETKAQIAPVVTALPLVSQAQAQTQEKIEIPVSGLIQIKAPMVGTFYRAPSPEASPYVEVGSLLEVGQVICIIEAMKLMNEIKSEVKGTVKQILAENGDPVEFGQVLFLVEPT